MTTQDAERARWKKDWEHMQTDHAKDAARSLYPLGVAAASQKHRLAYEEAAAYLNACGKGYGGARHVLPLDALAGLCATLEVPDLSAIFWSQATIGLRADTSPDANLPRWQSIADKEAEEQSCYTHSPWPTASSV